ncbi:hypothetical protein BpHYR1_013863 [Brachionus plicatilis]|uniref:Uncharacterized protein n=1 Tax=Brachionus plicatilis TaxID=10195 RepID=A0A3M7SAY9_BRAPC|nr:hypothetical protein BpHYR1_013863 [Brachionus plicatilis]
MLCIFEKDKVIREYELVQPISQFKKAIYKDKIFLFFSYSLKLRCLDKDFHTLDEGNVSSEVLSMAATNMFVFCLIEDNLILKFSHKVNLLQKIKINEENLDGLAQYMNKYDQLRSFRDSIFLSKKNGMLCINSMNLKEFKKLPIKEKKYVFYNEKIVTLNADNDQIVFYDFSGMVIQKQELTNWFGKHLIMIQSENYDKISFFDFSNFILFVF